ncbi:family 49 glycosyl hydrolase [Streptomyces sp. NPDC007861]|uniref:family 49 glycosyl hydrolase n=1 Tax=Streptomyces sp. NPDC007861 TaxID=3154893 RepID=UPI00340C4C99
MPARQPRRIARRTGLLTAAAVSVAMVLSAGTAAAGTVATGTAAAGTAGTGTAAAGTAGRADASSAAAAEGRDAAVTPGAAATAATADTAQLRTWWHDNHELNTSTAVASDKVRRSAFYDVKVATAAAPATKYDSFAYMSIPRSGKGKIGYTGADGAEFADSADLTMSWSSFQYATDVWVDVSLRSGQTISSASQVRIRPSSLQFTKELVDATTVRIKVPYSPKGHRFSVEFDPQLYTAYNDMSGVSGALTTAASGNRAVHTEPRNAMMVFAEPVLTGAELERLVPTSGDGSIYYPPQGQVTDLNSVSQEIVYFRPGTYAMGNKYHAVLPANVKWVYLAPGAYVKGAFRFFHDTQSLYKVTGHGVLSGEQYVYEADTANNYDHRAATSSNCHRTCVKMLQFESSGTQQHLDLQGVTINEPPYHSFVVYNEQNTGTDEHPFEMRVDNYKQVGSWYWQTDGIELYQGSTMKNTFFHANDDVLKMYHSDVTIDDTVVWKAENGPVIQWGWTPRTIDNVLVTNTHVIHNRMFWKDVKYNTCVLNSSSHWEDMGSTTKADPGKTVRNMRFENITVEGMTNCAIRLYALSSTENIHVKNLRIDGWNALDLSAQASKLKRYSNASGQKVTIGNETSQGKGLKLENYTVGGTVVEKTGGNWAHDKAGRLDFDAENWDSWNAWSSSGALTGRIANTSTGKCVDRAGGGTADGTAIQQWSCADVPAMTWTLDGQQLKSGGTCADTVGGGTANGTKVHTWDCGSQDSQKWVWRPNGTLQNVKSGRCLDVENQSTADGARLHLWDCGSQTSQRWTLLTS